MASISNHPLVRVDVQTLQTIPLLADIPEHELAELAATGHRRHFDSGALLIRQDDIAEELFIIETGTADVEVLTRDGQVHVIDTLGATQPVGELGVLNGGRRTATVRAKGPVTAIVVPRDAFLLAMERRGVARRIATALAGRLAARTRARALEDPPVARLLFSNPRLAPIWIVLRLWLAYQWLSAGVTNRINQVWMSTGLSLQGY